MKSYEVNNLEIFSKLLIVLFIFLLILLNYLLFFNLIIAKIRVIKNAIVIGAIIRSISIFNLLVALSTIITKSPKVEDLKTK